MDAFNKYIDEYKKQLAKGDIQKAHKGLMEYILKLRTHFNDKYPDYFVSKNIYQGYMDMTYFSLFPKFLKSRKLKIAIVFTYDAFRFEIWLAGVNKDVQRKYWHLFRENKFSKYHIPSTITGIDSIVEHALPENANFSNLDILTEQIEKETMKFINDIESFLSVHD